MPQIFKPTSTIKQSVQILLWVSYKYKGPFTLYVFPHYVWQVPHYADTFQLVILTQVIKRLFQKLKLKFLNLQGRVDQGGEELNHYFIPIFIPQGAV